MKLKQLAAVILLLILHRFVWQECRLLWLWTSGSWVRVENGKGTSPTGATWWADSGTNFEDLSVKSPGKPEVYWSASRDDFPVSCWMYRDVTNPEPRFLCYQPVYLVENGDCQPIVTNPISKFWRDPLGIFGSESFGWYSRFFSTDCHQAHNSQELFEELERWLSRPQRESWRAALENMPAEQRRQPFLVPPSVPGELVNARVQGDRATLTVAPMFRHDDEAVELALVRDGDAWKIDDPLIDWTGRFTKQTRQRWPRLGMVEDIYCDDVARLDRLVRVNPFLLQAASDGKTTLHRAAEAGSPKVIAYLLDRGLPLEAVDSYGQTPLHEAVDKPAALTALLERGANLEHQDQHGKTPLHWACWHLNVESVEILLAHGAKCRTQSQSQRTPLHAAMDRDHTINPGDPESAMALAKILIKNGADPHAKDKEGQTPLDLARESGLDATVHYLEAATQRPAGKPTR